MSDQEQKAPMSSFSRALLAGLSLSIVTVFCILVVYQAQKATEEVRMKNLNEGAIISRHLDRLLPEDARGKGITYSCRFLNDKRIGGRMPLYLAYSDKKLKGYILTYSTNKGYSSPLTMVTGLDSEKRIFMTDIEFSNETPGFGDRADRNHGDFLDMFSGKTINNAAWEIKKYGGDFDYLSGATITSRALVSATKDALSVLEETDLGSLPPCSRKRK